MAIPAPDPTPASDLDSGTPTEFDNVQSNASKYGFDSTNTSFKNSGGKALPLRGRERGSVTSRGSSVRSRTQGPTQDEIGVLMNTGGSGQGATRGGRMGVGTSLRQVSAMARVPALLAHHVFFIASTRFGGTCSS